MRSGRKPLNGKVLACIIGAGAIAAVIAFFDIRAVMNRNAASAETAVAEETVAEAGSTEETVPEEISAEQTAAEETPVESTNAKTMRLAASEGTVTVTDDTGADVPVVEDLPLGDGYGIETGDGSSAWIYLDDAKLLRMDENSSCSLTKDGGKLNITLNAGALFFCVSQPLADDESMTFESGGGTTFGIRGTSGVIECLSGTETAIALLEGAVEGTDRTGEAFSLTAGQDLYLYKDENGETGSIRRAVYKEDIPVFAADEIGGNSTVSAYITSNGGDTDPISYQPYIDALQAVIDRQESPTGDTYGSGEYTANVYGNGFAVSDVDHDGRDELIIRWFGYKADGSNSYKLTDLGIFDYNESSGQWTEEARFIAEQNYDYWDDVEYICYFPPDFIFMGDDGQDLIVRDYVKSLDGAAASDIWDEYIYSYNAGSDTYVQTGTVRIWPAEVPEDSDGTPYPSGIDTENAGTVYGIICGTDYDGDWYSESDFYQFLTELADGTDLFNCEDYAYCDLDEEHIDQVFRHITPSSEVRTLPEEYQTGSWEIFNLTGASAWDDGIASASVNGQNFLFTGCFDTMPYSFDGEPVDADDIVDNGLPNAIWSIPIDSTAEFSIIAGDSCEDVTAEEFAETCSGRDGVLYVIIEDGRVIYASIDLRNSTLIGTIPDAIRPYNW